MVAKPEIRRLAGPLRCKPGNFGRGLDDFPAYAPASGVAQKLRSSDASSTWCPALSSARSRSRAISRSPDGTGWFGDLRGA